MDTPPIPAGSRSPPSVTDFELIRILINLSSAVGNLSNAVKMLAAHAPAGIRTDAENLALVSSAKVDAAFDKITELLA